MLVSFNKAFKNIPKIAKFIIISVIIISTITFGLFFYFQKEAENKIRDSIFEQQREIQLNNNKDLAEDIQFGLNSIQISLEGLAFSTPLKNGDFALNTTNELVQFYFGHINSFSPINNLFIIDNEGITRINISQNGQSTFTGKNFSNVEWVIDTEESLSSVFSEGFIDRDGWPKIAITYPIINTNKNINSKANNSNIFEREEGQYMGLVGAEIHAVKFFEHYANINNLDSKFLTFLDSKALHLVHPFTSLIGKSFFGNYSQNFTGHNKILNNLISTVTGGKPSLTAYEFSTGERVTTGYPIYLQDEPRYSVFIIHPTATIYSKVYDIISTQRLEILSILAGFIATMSLLVMYLIHHSSILDKEVKRRTRELEKTNAMQREFIHTTSHELRNHIQPILSLSEMIKDKLNDDHQIRLQNLIIKNALKLRYIMNDILDLARIDKNNLALRIEKFKLYDFLADLVDEFQTYFLDKNNKIQLEIRKSNDVSLSLGKTNDNTFYDDEKNFEISADRMRLSLVMFNLINNANKFTESGIIKILVEVLKDKIKFSVIDTGNGIEENMIPKLFTQYSTTSFQGTGLGLYICKNIIEAHRGKIWAENNINRRGAIFSFSLPMSKEESNDN